METKTKNKNKKTKRCATKRGIATTKRSKAPTKTGLQAVRKRKPKRKQI